VVPAFVLFPIGVGILLSALVSVWVPSSPDIVWVSAVIVGVVFFSLRKIYRLFHPEKPVSTAADRYVGQRVEVMSKVDYVHKDGEVKLYGEAWTAMSLHKDEVFEKNEVAVVAAIDGNKLLLVKLSDLK